MMARHRRIALVLNCAAAIVLRASCGFAEDDPPRTPERRAIAFLSAEVAQWEHENHCFSCHNNGDAARALMGAISTGELTDRAPLAETLRFLAAPETWDGNGPDGPFKDKKLARIQFAAALAEANRTGTLDDRDALRQAGLLVAELQSPEGYWETDAPGTIGSPVTYGRALATAISLRTLRAGDADKYRAAIGRATRWFEQTDAKNVLTAAATLLALADIDTAPARARREQCVEVIHAGRSSDGGWGPFVNAPPESFDTALVMLALAAQRGTATRSDWIAGGRQFLIDAQEPDGGWPPTTRPPGVDSYAQRLSTTGWALQALLATRPK